MTVCKLIVAILLTLCTNAIAQTSFWTQPATPDLAAVRVQHPLQSDSNFILMFRDRSRVSVFIKAPATPVRI